MGCYREVGPLTWQRGTVARLLAAGGAVLLAASTALLAGASASAERAAGAGLPPAGPHTRSGAESAVISRSSYGVPSIYAKTMAGVWFGAGWAQAQDRMAQLELTRRTVEGTLSGIFGPSQLAQDQDVRTFFYTSAELRAQYRSLPRATRMALVAFSDGINAYEASAYATPASEQAKVPYEFFALGKSLGLSSPYRPARWAPVDTVAVGNFLARQFGGGGGSELQNLGFLQYLQAELAKDKAAHPLTDATAIFNDARWIDDTTAPTTVPGPAAPAAAAARAAARTAGPA